MWFKSKNEDYFKLISFKTYAWDRTINNTRRYRKVFDRSELNYLSVAFEFYNKHFDEKDWECAVTFKAFKLKDDGNTLLCEHTQDYSITKDLNVAICDYGWGNDDYGTFWEEGDYAWDLFVNDKFITSTKFHIYNVGKVTNSYNPYFDVDSIKTFEFERDSNGDDTEKKFYQKQFLYKYTNYIMTEFSITNKVAYPWLCELNFNYYDDSGLLIGTSNDLSYINSDNVASGSTYTLENAWGNKETSVWLKDHYRVEIVFMDTVVAKLEFSVGDDIIVAADDYNEEDFLEDYMDENVEEDIENQTESIAEEKNLEEEIGETELDTIDIEENKSLGELMKELDSLIGLSEIKEKIRDYIDYVSFLQLREEKGIDDEDQVKLHSVFTGNPGTGKTTVVKLLGQIYHAMGLLSKGHVLTVESSDLVTGFVRQTGKNTKEIIKKARGGILFIDEAYMLYKDDSSNDFGPEAIAALITEMSDGKGDIAIMVAGYPKEMEKFINSNPGLKSRFKNHYHFRDYTPDELVAIAKFSADKKEVILSDKAEIKLKQIATEAYRNRNKSFGNARFINSVVDEAKMNLGIRLIRNNNIETLTKEMLITVLEQDIEDVSKRSISKALKLDIDQVLLQEALNELNALTGLNSIKKEVQELIKLVKYYKEIDRDILKAFSMHSVFIGNPGTGKTTIARILGKVYKALGLLERGHLVEADGSSLIAGFVGQTALKTKELIKQAKGGILFIDEAYSITEGNNSTNDFGKKAIAALLKEMEDHRGEFGVIAAGYTDNMKSFLKSNPGLKSRFDTTYNFEDFNEEELWNICVSMFKSKELKVDSKAEAHIKTYINQLYKNKTKYFGNARTIRKLVEKAYRNQQLRMANLAISKRTKKMISSIILDDVFEFDNSKEMSLVSKTIGYKNYK